MMDCLIVELNDEYIWAYIEDEPVSIDGVLYSVIELNRVDSVAIIEKIEDGENSDSQGE
jgi:hypothetical protein